MQIVHSGDKLHEMPKTISEEKKKGYFYVTSAEMFIQHDVKS